MYQSDDETLKRLVTFGRQWARRQANGNLDHVVVERFEDAATDGLVRALQKFDPGRNVPFEAYARRQIRWYVGKAFERRLGNPAATARRRERARRDKAAAHEQPGANAPHSANRSDP